MSRTKFPAYCIGFVTSYGGITQEQDFEGLAALQFARAGARVRSCQLQAGKKKVWIVGERLKKGDFKVLYVVLDGVEFEQVKPRA